MNNIYYLQKSANGITQVNLKSKLFEKRVIFLDDEINPESVNNIISQLTLLAAENSSKPITLVINSPGGSIRDGLVLVDVMRSLPCPINTISLGMAASMSGIILAAGTKGHRYISENSWVMLHQPLISGGMSSGKCSEVEQVAKSLLKRKKQINNLLAELTGRDINKIANLTSKESYLDAETALKEGLVDSIIHGKKLFELMTGGLI